MNNPQNQDSETRAFMLAQAAEAPSTYINPEAVIGADEWRRQVQADRDNAGAKALTDFRTAWDWHMTPGQRAQALVDTSFRSTMGSLVNDFAKSVDTPYVDPEVAAQKILDARMRR